jgi:uncharacterized protein YndB with AHSA1/START domain
VAANPADSVTEEVFIEASPETVFEFFLDPVRMRKWMGGHAVLEPSPGGLFAVDIGSNRARGRFVEVVHPERIVFTWGWEESSEVPPGASTVTVSFERRPDGTLLRLVHDGLDAEQAIRHRHGWIHYLSRLRIAAAGGDPGSDPHESADDVPLHRQDGEG